MAQDNRWIYCQQRYPSKNGKYLVVARINEKKTKVNNANIVFISEYNCKIGSFDFDLNMKEKGFNERIYAWQAIDPPPLHPDVLVSKENQKSHNKQ